MENKRIKLRGKIIMASLEYPHYELECDDGYNYALFGNIDEIDKLDNNQVEVIGKISDGALTHLRKVPFDVKYVKELN